jgi:tetratricopeptide (TPR) repeat protein
MFVTFRTLLTVLILIAISRSAGAAADEAAEMLARAEALYYQADFAKSVELLLRADELLRDQSGNLQEKSDVKLQLALGYIGLNDGNKAKAYLDQLYALDPDHQIDPQMFSPKVLKLAEEARTEQNELRCRRLSDQAEDQLAKGNSNGLLTVIESGRTKCAGLANLYPKASELLFREGVSAYKNSQMETALEKFRAALRLDPKNELAEDYVELTVSKLDVAADRAFIAWHKDYDSGDYASATRDYRDLTSRASSEKIEEVRAEYRRSLSRLVDMWNAECAKDDKASMEQTRQQINALLPEPSFADDILAKMKMCTQTGCLQMSTPQALVRLKTRVDPEFPSFVISQIATQTTVRVKATISAKGDVTAKDVHGDNPMLNNAVKTAIEQWRFSPALMDGEARCVDTEIPIVINKARN